EMGQWGKLLLTNFRLIFLPIKADEKISRSSFNTNYFDLNHRKFKIFSEFPIFSISKILCNKNNNSTNYVLTLKDCRSTKFVMNGDEKEIDNFNNELFRYAFPGEESATFAFCYKEAYSKMNEGWDLYKEEEEFRRMGLSSEWRVSNANKKFSLCDTYPQIIIVPAELNSKEIITIAKKRSKNRLPVLTYFYAPTGCAIIRSSQPSNGIFGQSMSLSKNYHIRFIFDARPRINAVANVASGGGFETLGDHKIRFCGIPNIHAMRESLNKFLNINQKTIQNYVSNESELDWGDIIKSSNWLSHIYLLLDCSRDIAELISKGG
ncbi:Carrier protein, mitochondrial, partial [Bonamia ostreae]